MSDGTVGARRALALVDDDPLTRRALKALLEDEGWEVETFADAEGALEPLAQGRFAALVTDYVLPGIRGTELARRARDADPALRCVVISGYERPAGEELPWFMKPVDVDALVAALATVAPR